MQWRVFLGVRDAFDAFGGLGFWFLDRGRLVRSVGCVGREKGSKFANERMLKIGELRSRKVREDGLVVYGIDFPS